MARRAAREAQQPPPRTVSPVVASSSPVAAKASGKTGKAAAKTVIASNSAASNSAASKDAASKGAAAKARLAKAAAGVVVTPGKVGGAKRLDKSKGDSSASEKLAALIRERDDLALKLRTAEARIGALEAREAQLADRISWALDTLSDLLRLPDAP